MHGLRRSVYRRVTGEDGNALSPELPIGYLKNGAWSMYEYEVQEILAPPGYGHSGETVSVVFDREKENLIQLYEVAIENKKTKVQLSKLDIATGEELPGASLELKTIDGTIVDSWISGKTPHFVEGTLVAGETYILTEISAPDGYETAEAIRFTVPKDGSFIKNPVRPLFADLDRIPIPDFDLFDYDNLESSKVNTAIVSRNIQLRRFRMTDRRSR